MFKFYDSDNNNVLSRGELNNMISKTIDQSIFELKMETLPEKGIIDQMKEGIVNEILEQMDKDNSQPIAWNEFIQFIDKASSLNQNLMNFLITGSCNKTKQIQLL